MKSDIDRLMSERNFDAIVILGPDGLSGVNAAFNYFVGGRHIVGTIFKRRGEPPQLVHGTMERDSAAETGLALININRWPMKEIAKQFPKPFEARVELYRQMLTDLGITGRVGFYGTAESNASFALLTALGSAVKGLTVVAEPERDLIETARETKDAAEIEAMRKVGVMTCEVVADVQRFIQSHSVKNETVTKADGKPLTVGDVKAFIRRVFAERNMESEDCIFAIGRDAGVPHNHGNPKDALVLGKSIIFDIFPRVPGGYYHDMTRTWCLGYAPAEVQKAYEDVQGCFEHVIAMMHPGIRTHKLQIAACEFFESKGHPTVRQDPANSQGYIHSLGHGLGLQVHENPGSPTFTDSPMSLHEGVTYTVEPGLYYPEKGFGVRIEDTYYCDEAGKFRSLTPYSYDLVVPMK